MRVVVISDAVAGLSPAAASERIGAQFAAKGAQVAVVPLAVSGQGLSDAVAACLPGAEFAAPATEGELVAALRSDAPSLVLDLGGLRVADFGRSVLAAFDPDPVVAMGLLRSRWEGGGLVALVPEDQAQRELTGLSGYASTELRAEGVELQEILRIDAEAGALAALLGLATTAGTGAAHGLGLLILGAGGTVSDPLTLLAQGFNLATTMRQADLIVTATQELDFHALGGPVVKRVAHLAVESLQPLIAVVGRNFVSSRELRLAGFESAYPLVPTVGSQDPTPERLDEVAAKVASTWAW